MMLPNPDAPNSRSHTGAFANGAEQRVNPRVEKRLPVEFLNMGDDPRVPFYQDFVPGETEDVAISGLRVRAAYDIPEGTEIGVVIRNRERFQVFLARVVWKVRGMASCVYGLSVPRLELTHLP